MAQTDEKNKKDKLTAGDKCAFGTMIFAKTKKEGWTLATKVLAVTYIDLSEKYGRAFASQAYLQFRTGISTRTMSRANNVIKKSKLFEVRSLFDDSLEVVPNLERIRAEYKKYQEEERRFKQERKDRMSRAESSETTPPVNLDDIPADKMSGATDKMSGDHRQNGGHNPSTESLHSNPSKFSHTASGEAVETGSGSENGGPSGAPADDEHTNTMNAYVEGLSQQAFLRILEEDMPAYVPFDKHRHQRDPARAAEYQFKNLMRLGWTRLEILEGVEAYLREYDRHDHSKEFHGNGKSGKTLGGLLVDMVTQCNPEFRNLPNGEMFDGWCIPDRFLIKPADKVKPAASNDNELSDIDLAV